MYFTLELDKSIRKYFLFFYEGYLGLSKFKVVTQMVCWVSEETFRFYARPKPMVIEIEIRTAVIE